MIKISDEQLVNLYQEVISELDVNDLEANGRKWEVPAAFLREEIQNIFLGLRDSESITAAEFGKILITIGLSAIAVGKYKERNQ